MKCSACQAENPANQKFCGECGSKIEKTCPACGGHNPPKYKFCGECGHDLTPACHITIFQNGLIYDVDSSCADLLGMEESELIGKSITLLIHAEDLVVFFKHRNTLFSSRKKETFELRLLGKDGAEIHSRIECGLAHDSEKDIHFMRMSIVDITRKRQALDELQSKKDLLKIILSMSSDLIRRPEAETDLGIIRVLKTIGVFSEVDRSYIYQFYENRTRISITHEWCSDGVEAQDRRLKMFSEPEIPDIFSRVKSRKRIIVDDIGDLPINEKASAKKFHIKGIRSSLCFPMIRGDELFGIIGCDSLKKKKMWPEDVIYLFGIAGEIVLNSIVCQKAGKAGAGLCIGEEAIRLAGNVNSNVVSPGDDGAAEMHEIYDGPIELEEVPPETVGGAPEADARMEEAPPVEMPEMLNGPIELREISNKEDDGEPDPDARANEAAPAEWTYRKGAPEDPSTARKVFKKLDKVRIACPRCGRKKELSVSEIDELGNTLQVKCVCNYEFHTLLELRNFFRKKVRFEGFFVKIEPGKIVTDSDRDWGGVTIKNLSKSGIGFVTSRRHSIKPGDEFKVKFTLDNSARTLINKDVVVKSVRGDYVGCQFLGEDKQDITLGFYLL